MFKTKEIRWFFPAEDTSISNWFQENGYIFENTESRTDYYLSLIEKEDVGIKLRENNIEVKHRTERSEKEKLAKGINGYFERYIKWSFSSAEEDTLVQEITSEEKYDWLPVRKERLGFKLTKNANGEIRRVSIDDYPEAGCQVEYTRVKVKDELWYTFSLEWFGSEELQFDFGLIGKIIGNSSLKAKDSMGYAEFLKKI